MHPTRPSKPPFDALFGAVLVMLCSPGTLAQTPGGAAGDPNQATDYGPVVLRPVPEERPRRVYRWVNEFGETEFGYFKPKGTQAEVLDIRLADPAPPASAQDPEPPAEGTLPPPETPTREVSEAEKALYAANCQIARDNLKTLDADPDRIWERDAAGNLAPVGAEEVEARRTQARRDIETYCR